MTATPTNITTDAATAPMKWARSVWMRATNRSEMFRYTIPAHSVVTPAQADRRNTVRMLAGWPAPWRRRRPAGLLRAAGPVVWQRLVRVHCLGVFQRDPAAAQGEQHRLGA